jgi:hypothetical protein
MVMIVLNQILQQEVFRKHCKLFTIFSWTHVHLGQSRLARAKDLKNLYSGTRRDVDGEGGRGGGGGVKPPIPLVWGRGAIQAPAVGASTNYSNGCLVRPSTGYSTTSSGIPLGVQPRTPYWAIHRVLHQVTPEYSAGYHTMYSLGYSTDSPQGTPPGYSTRYPNKRYLGNIVNFLQYLMGTRSMSMGIGFSWAYPLNVIRSAYVFILKKIVLCKLTTFHFFLFLKIFPMLLGIATVYILKSSTPVGITTVYIFKQIFHKYFHISQNGRRERTG